MAEGVFSSLTSKPPYQAHIKSIDSAGTGAYHTGSEPDDRTMSTLQSYGISDYVHAARKVRIYSYSSADKGSILTSKQVRLSDFDDFDYVFAMDRSNLRDLQRLQQKKPEGKAKVMLFGEYSGGKAEVMEDPYYGGKEGFETAYKQCLRFSKNFLEKEFPGVAA